MATEVFKINYGEKAANLDRLTSLLDDYLQGYSDYKKLGETEKEVLESLWKMVETESKELDSQTKNLCEFFKSKFNRYWLMTVTKIKNGIADPKRYVIYPYHLTSNNNYLSCLITNDIYREGMLAYEFDLKDGGFIIGDFFGDKGTIEMDEITKEDFEKMCKSRIDALITRAEGRSKINVKTLLN